MVDLKVEDNHITLVRTECSLCKPQVYREWMVQGKNERWKDWRKEEDGPRLFIKRTRWLLRPGVITSANGARGIERGIILQGC